MSTIKDKITLYSNEHCNYCTEVKKALDEAKIDYTNVDTQEHKDVWRKVVDTTFIPTVPTLLYKDTYLVAGRDFANANVLVTLLEEFKGLDMNDPKLVLERIRTLTYSITMAFGRMDNILRNIEKKLDEQKSL